MGRVYAVGVGPGSPRYVTGAAEDAIRSCGIVAGYRYTMNTIRHLLDGKETYHITMADQEATYRRIRDTMGGRSLAVPFTGTSTSPSPRWWTGWPSCSGTWSSYRA